MSFFQRIGQPSTRPSGIGREEFDSAVQFFNHAFELYRKSSVIDCPCYDEEYEAADPACPLCEGTGSSLGWTKQPINSFMGIMFINPEYNQDQHQRLYTKSGPVDTMDSKMYVSGVWFDTIKKEDVIVWRLPNSAEGIEFMVISTVPRFGQNGEIIFIRCDMERPITRKVLSTSNIKSSL